MRSSRSPLPRLPLAAAALAVGLCAIPGAWAQAVPNSFVASPDIYKVIAENEQYRVISVTWKQGQRDVQHSHPASAVYYVTDCKLRGYSPNGVGEFSPKAGMAIVQKPIAAHSMENIGDADCRLIMFEPKQ